VAGLELDYNASFSADGAWVVFTSERNGSSDVFRVRTNGMGLERLTDDPAFDDQGVLSPDGNSLAFVSTRDTGSTDIYLLDLKTRRTRNLTNSPGGDYRPSWSPDGRRIAFSSDRGTAMARSQGNWEQVQAASVYVIGVDGRDLHKLPSGEGQFAGSPKWSPDGARVVFYELAVADTFRARGLGAQATIDSRIVSVDLATGARTEHTSSPGLKLSPQFLDPRSLPTWPGNRCASGTGLQLWRNRYERRHQQSGLVERWSPGGVSPWIDRDHSGGPQARRVAVWQTPAIRPPFRERFSGRVARRTTNCRQRTNRPRQSGRSDLAGRLEYRWHEPPAHLPRRGVVDVASVVPGRTVDRVRDRFVLRDSRNRACSHHDREARRLRRPLPDNGAGQLGVSQLVTGWQAGRVSILE
jgi:hypothetical protein